MNKSTFLDNCNKAAELQLQRVETILVGNEDRLKGRLENDWSAIQIFDHLVKSNEPYINNITNALPNAKKGDSQIAFTMFGRFIAKFAGPNGNAPAPKPFVPSANPDRSVIEVWKNTHNKMIELLNAAKDVDLSKTKVKNPVIKMFSMNLCDCFEIWVQHTERHVQQIERGLM